MAGIGFELRKAIENENPLKKAEGYASAAFSAGGTILVGIVIVCAVQYAAVASSVDKAVVDRFMCLITQTMFASMLASSVISMTLSRYAADKIYLKQREKIFPSLLGGSITVSVYGSIIFIVLMKLSGITDCVFPLLMFFIILSNCWILMSYISLIKEYRKIAAAYLSALVLSAGAVIILAVFNLFSLNSMFFVMILAYAAVDIILFSAVYSRYAYSEGSMFEFTGWFKKYPALPAVSLFLMVGMLNHFWVEWVFSDSVTVIGGIFRFDPTYDFPAIMAYVSTIPTMCYFITIFETEFELKYSNYFDLLSNKNGNIEQIEQAHNEMTEVLAEKLKILMLIQISSCLIFMTIIGKFLSVLNIGMTTDMLSTFRLFCIGYSFYEIGSVLILLQLYFLNENKAAAAVVMFSLCSFAGSLAAVHTGYKSAGLIAGSFLLMVTALIQLGGCLMRLEEHILLNQPVYIKETSLRDGFLGDIAKKTAAFFGNGKNTSGRNIITGVCVCLIIAFTGTAIQINTYIKDSRVYKFTPEASEAVLKSPNMGLAPWANSEDTLNMDTSLVYIELKWSEWEPEEGFYDIEGIKDEFYIEEYKESGRNAVFRFICDDPDDEDMEDSEHLDIPVWLYEKINHDGTWYDNSYGKGFSPNYNNEILIKEHTEAIAALGAAFGSDNFISFVELGSLGHWGEWNTNINEGLYGIPVSEVREEYIKPYLAAFPNSDILIRYPLGEVEKYGFGIYNDMTGDQSETQYWLQKMNSSEIWEQSGELETVSCEDNWKTYPVGGEFASTYENKYFISDNLSSTIDMLVQSHQSFIGPKVIIDEEETDYSSEMDSILKAIGYRYRVSSVTADLSEKDVLKISCTITNDGCAPVYDYYNVELYLLDDDNSIVEVFDKNEIDLRNVLPGEETVFDVSADITELDDEINYTLAIAVTDDYGEAVLPMALTEEISPKVYGIAAFNLVQ